MKPRLSPNLLRSSRRPLSSPSTQQHLLYPPPSITTTTTTTLRNPITISKRTLVAAPQANSGPILSRRPDRELPDVGTASRNWLWSAPLFILIVGASSAAIFNYEKSSSSVVSATLYSLRTHPEARALLGDEIYFRDRWPWVWGELNQVHGRINIGYGVKGTRAKGFMRFAAERKSRTGFFETSEWSLELEDGTRLMLLDGGDPFSRAVQEAEA